MAQKQVQQRKEKVDLEKLKNNSKTHDIISGSRDMKWFQQRRKRDYG